MLTFLPLLLLHPSHSYWPPHPSHSLGHQSPLHRNQNSPGGVHVDVVPVGDVLVVDDGGGDAGVAVRAADQGEERLEELLGEALHDALGGHAEHLHLPLVRLRHAVALEPVLVAALLLAHLAVPPQLLQALRLDPVRDRLRRQELVLPHRTAAAPADQLGEDLFISGGE